MGSNTYLKGAYINKLYRLNYFYDLRPVEYAVSAISTDIQPYRDFSMRVIVLTEGKTREIFDFSMDQVDASTPVPAQSTTTVADLELAFAIGYDGRDISVVCYENKLIKILTGLLYGGTENEEFSMTLHKFDTEARHVLWIPETELVAIIDDIRTMFILNPSGPTEYDRWDYFHVPSVSDKNERISLQWIPRTEFVNVYLSNTKESFIFKHYRPDPKCRDRLSASCNSADLDKTLTCKANSDFISHPGLIPDE